jgi:hypothetical protein
MRRLAHQQIFSLADILASGDLEFAKTFCAKKIRRIEPHFIFANCGAAIGHHHHISEPSPTRSVSSMSPCEPHIWKLSTSAFA